MNDLIDFIPQILQYYIPGYLSLYIFNTLLHKKMEDNNSMHINSCVISFFLAALANIVLSLLNYQVEIWPAILLEFVFGIVFSLLLWLVRTSNKFEKFLVKEAKISLYNSVLNDLFSETQFIQIILKDVKDSFAGQYISHDDRCIMIANIDDRDARTIFWISDIKYIETIPA